jgi:anionic cell wall polymer biosynthesis LytR-Cps2A-Psr (LCP) family protein
LVKGGENLKNNRKLDFSSKDKKDSKRFKSFIISFAAFVIILGGISLLMFMKSIDFNLGNLVSSSDDLTTEPETESTTSPVVMEGQSEIIVMCYDTDGNASFVFLISTDIEKKTIAVNTVPTDIIGEYNGTSATLSEHFKKSGAGALVKAFAGYSGITADRYISIGELQFKSFVSKFKDIVVDVPSATDPKTSGGLTLNAGSQSLSADMFLKYLKYSGDSDKSAAFSSFLRTVLDPSHIGSMDNLFEYIVNNSQTDISIVDYTKEKDKLVEFVNTQGEINNGGVFTKEEKTDA